MFEKIIKRLKSCSCETTIADDVNVFTKSEKKQEDSTKWNTIVKIVVLIGKVIQILLEMCLFMKKLMFNIQGKNKMKYQCSKCDFHWTGTSYTFEEVRQHEKTHLENKKSKTRRVKNNV